MLTVFSSVVCMELCHHCFLYRFHYYCWRSFGPVTGFDLRESNFPCWCIFCAMHMHTNHCRCVSSPNTHTHQTCIHSSLCSRNVSSNVLMAFSLAFRLVPSLSRFQSSKPIAVEMKMNFNESSEISMECVVLLPYSCALK